MFVFLKSVFGRARQINYKIQKYSKLVIVLMITVFGFAGFLEKLAYSGPLLVAQEKVSHYLDESERKALETFVVARAINATISVFKTLDISIVLANIDIGEVLEPIDDLAKQLSDVMVVIFVSLFVQKIIISMSVAWALGLVLPIGGSLIIFSTFLSRLPSISIPLSRVGTNLIISAIFFRFAIFAVGLIGLNITDRFLASDLDASMHIVHQSADRLSESLNNSTVTVSNSSQVSNQPLDLSAETKEKSVGDSKTIFGEIGGALRNTTQNIVGAGSSALNSVTRHMPDISAIISYVIELPSNIVKIISIFIFQTIIMPVVVLFLLYRFICSLFAVSSSGIMIGPIK